MIENFIYSNVLNEILYCINGVLLKCLDYGEDSDKLRPDNEELIECFNGILVKDNERGRKVKAIDATLDRHITEGLFEAQQVRGDKVYPRIIRLTLNAYNGAREVKTKPRRQKRGAKLVRAVLLPSPLNILYYTLIIPDHPETAAYSLAACRTYMLNILEHAFKLHGASDESEFLGSITEASISETMASLSRNERMQARWPKEAVKKSLKTYTNFLTAHFLSMKGTTNLWFSSKAEAKRFLDCRSVENVFEHFSKNITRPRFRLSNRFETLPESGELINQLYGVPIAIRGADIVFFGGLKRATSGSLILGVSGQAGIGKTSFALALANSFAPLGIQTFYLSLEEDVGDIEKRLYSLQTPYEKVLSYYVNPERWFFVDKVRETLTLENLIKLVEEMRLKIDKKRARSASNQAISQCDSVIVIDNLNEFYDAKEFPLVERLVEELRKFKRSIIVLAAGEDVLEKLRMEYLIDVGIKLMHEGLEKEGERPLRLFNLYKTRHQLSRQGTHVFHMSGDQGFRISPQVPSQMDRKERFKRYLYDDSRTIHILNYLDDDGKLIALSSNLFPGASDKESDAFLRIFPRTHILVHGYGSAGKAGFAVKLLLTPPIETDMRVQSLRNRSFEDPRYRRKVLIVSFLYSNAYYQDLIYDKDKLQNIIRQNYKNIQDPIIDHLIFYPGFISPEDFINKVIRKLDQATLEGQPFNGVLIDGLHNVFLQFQRLQENDMVWPLLYNILARYDLTVVSTFTNFAMNDRLIDDDPASRNKMVSQAIPDYMLLQKGMAPFLHALVKASDFYFFLEQMVFPDGARKYLLSVKGAIRQDVPTELLEWSRERNVFTGSLAYKQYRELMEFESNRMSDHCE